MLAVIIILIAVVLVAAATFAVLALRRSHGTALSPRPAPRVEAAPQPDEAPQVVLPETGLDEAPAPPVEVEAAERPRIRDRIGRTRGVFAGYLGGLRSRKGIDDASWDDLEEALILADAGVATTTRVLDDLRIRVKSGELADGEALLGALKSDLKALFAGEDRALGHGVAAVEGAGGPTLWLFVGVNGVGKTTTIGKLAAREAAAGRKVVMAAGDTFRAAAGEQLDTWAERAGAGIIRGADGADPSSVIFDAVQHAAARGADLVLADTAGRLHTKVNLMEELRKVRRVAERPPAQLTEVLLVIDATTGQNGLAQARQFTDAVGVTGIVLTKLDGTAKGGIVLAIRDELGLPIKLVGLGEQIEDLIEFDPDEFVEALFAD
jgi:fused signal recognition particle receptor